MGNSNTSYLPTYNCYDENISRNSVTPEFWESHSISEGFKISAIISAVFALLLMLVGLPANALIIVSIIQHKLYKEAAHILLLNLAISDFLLCLLVMPFTVVAGFAGGYVFGESDYVRCQVCQTGVIFLCLMLFSLNVLGIMSADRFIFIRFPLRYKQWVTTPRLFLILALTWLTSIIIAVLPFVGFGGLHYAYSYATCAVTLKETSIYYGLLLVLLSIPPVATIIITNIWIACIARKQIAMVYKTRKTFQNKGEMSKFDQTLHNTIQRKRSKKQRALVKTFGGIIISTFIVWLPVVSQVVATVFVDRNTIPLGIFTFSFTTFYSQAVVHPLAQGCFVTEVKETLKKMLGITYCKNVAKRQREKIAVDNALEISENDFVEPKQCCRWCCDLFSIFLLPANELTNGELALTN